jgi:copper chaperone CopZ
MTHLRLAISGMTGVPCRQKIERAVLELPGVEAVVVCLGQGYADVEYEETELDPRVLLETIAQAGYRARIGG